MCQIRSKQYDTPAVLTYFRQRAPEYSVASAAGFWGWQRQREAAVLRILAGDIKGRAVLDLGCGAGFYASRMADAGARKVVAVDASPAMIAAITDLRVERLMGDAATITLDRRFDVVVLAGLLEFVTDPIAVLTNARRHLKRGGRIVVLVPRQNFAGRLYRRFHRRHGFTVSLFDRVCFARMTKQVGLALLRSQAVFPFSDVHALVVR